MQYARERLSKLSLFYDIGLRNRAPRRARLALSNLSTSCFFQHADIFPLALHIRRILSGGRRCDAALPVFRTLASGCRATATGGITNLLLIPAYSRCMELLSSRRST
ncbi:hypothetical protein GY45DRAFT_731210 [Cubamyces sp. BRFM 1775]|nr:hypothetical protein GY45DRAFT_731210 [Cubamyces sp. BRFM 1775]